MPPRKRLTSFLLTTALAALATLSAAGCGEGFDPYNRIQEMRVLAIRSEPVAPAPGETTTLSALVYTPEPDPTVTYAWSWCPLPGPANDGYRCLISEAELRSMLSAAGLNANLPVYDLGTGPTAQLPHTIDPALLTQLCAASLPGSPTEIDCLGGFPVQVKLVVKSASDEITSVRRLRLRLAPGGEPNSNPRVEGLFHITKDAAGTETSAAPIGETPEVTLFRTKEAKLRVAVPADVPEPYTGRDDNQQPMATREKLTLAWFVETGDVEDDQTNFAEGLSTLARALENDWEPGRTKDYPRTTARVFVVVRDNRDGVAWTSGVVRLEEAP